MRPSRTRYFIAGTVGILIALLTLFRISLPATRMLTQFFQFSPLVRAILLVKLLSPLLSFCLVSGWIIALLWLAELLRSDHGNHSENVQPHHHQSVPGREAAERRRLEAKRQITVPPLFQLDPSTPWQQVQLPITPLPLIPLTNSDSSAVADEVEAESEAADGAEDVETAEEAADGEERPALTQAEEILHSQVVDVPSPQGEDETQPTSESSPNTFSLHARELSETLRPVTMTLLQQMEVWVRADDSTTMQVKLRGGENAIRLIQLAYIAWRKGASVDRDKMLTYVLSRGKRRDMTTDQLGEVFDAAKRYLRQDLDRAVQGLAKNGHPLSEEVDFFSTEPGFYWLHSSCRVADLEMIDELHHSIQVARKEGLLAEKLNGALPAWVVEACQKLKAAYPGDFLQSLLEDFPEEFGPWVKEPVTLYRDKYLDAHLILANYESALGKHSLDEALSAEGNEERRRHHIGKAAQLFYDYAMYALNNRWDQKLKFAYRAGKDGERVVMAERALRRCVVELGKLGRSETIDQAYLTFKERMAKLSEGTWKPDADTERDVANAKTTTNAYRFESQMATSQQSHSSM